MRNVYFLLNSTTQNFQNRLMSFHAKVFCFLEFVEKIWYIFTQCSISVAQMRYMFAVINSVKNNNINIFTWEWFRGQLCLVTLVSLKYYGRAYFSPFQQYQRSSLSTNFCWYSSFWITPEISFEKVSNEDGCEIQYHVRGWSTTTISTQGSNMKQIWV